jgi:hypothetical protein
MKPVDPIKANVAKSLLNQRDPGRRKRTALTCLGGLLALFLIHAYFSNLASPLKLIPQTFCAIGMGYALLYLLSLRRFEYVAEFIDWAKVKQSAGEASPSDDGAPTTQG